MTSLSNSSQSTRPVGRVFWKNYSSFLDFTCNYEWTSGIFVPCWFLFVSAAYIQAHFGLDFFIKHNDVAVWPVVAPVCM